MNLTALLQFESAIIKGAQTQSDSLNSFVAASLRYVIQHFFQITAPSFLIVVSCQRPSPQNFFKEMMQKMYTTVDNMIIELAHVNVSEPRTLEHTRFLNLLLVDSLEAFLDIQLHEYVAGFDTNEYYYIFLMQRDRFIPGDMQGIFDYCWKYHLINCNIQIQDAQGEVTMYTYFPYRPGRCQVIDPVYINKFIGPGWESPIIFHKKLRNFHYCPLRVMVRDIPPFMKVRKLRNSHLKVTGMEGQLLTTLGEKHNFRLETRLAEVDERTGNFCCGAINYIISKQVDIGIGYYRKWLGFQNVTTTFPHYQNRHVASIWIESYTLNAFDSWTFPFNNLAWSTILVTYLLVYIFAYLLNSWLRRGNSTLNSSILWDMLAVSLGMAVPIRNDCLSNRLFYTAFILSSFLIRCFYSALLYHLFRYQIHRNFPQSISEVFEKNFIPVMNEFTLGDLAAFPYYQRLQTMKTIILNGTAENTATEYLEFFGTKQTRYVAFSTRDFLVDYVRRHQKAGMYYIIPDPVATQGLTIYLQKHSYLVDIFNEAIMKFNANGLMEYWMSQHLDERYFNSRHLFQDRFLGQHELIGIYYMIGCLYLIAAIVFLFEILSMKSRCLKKFFRKMQ